MTNSDTSQTIRGLNELLRGELSALDTYDQALAVLTDDPAVKDDLRECRASHSDRVERLRMEIVERGGQPDSESGAWGVFAKAIEGSAATFGWKMAVMALEAGEDHGVKEYDHLMPSLDGAARDILSIAVYPQQLRTHKIMSALKHRQGDSSPSA